MSDKKTAIVTGAQQGIGAGLVDGFLKAGYNVVATSLHASKSLTASPRLVLVDGDIRDPETAAKTTDAAITHFETINALVNNAGISLRSPSRIYHRRLQRPRLSQSVGIFVPDTARSETNIETEVRRSVVNITASLADQPIAGVTASVSMITKGGLNTVIRRLAIEYAKEGIRFNAVAPGVVGHTTSQR